MSSNSAEKSISKEAVLEKILDGALAEKIELETERRENVLWVPSLEMTIKPVVVDANEHFANIEFTMYSGVWDTEFVECSVGMGKDVDSALGMALGVFALSFMNGLKNAVDNRAEGRFTSHFAGNDHNWTLYVSNVAGAGVGRPEKVSEYWKLLEEDIVTRLGNQKVTYVKVYTSKNGDNIICECRINDVPVPELSYKLYPLADEWDINGFVSEKQFFFLVQDDDTIQKYRYSGKEGREKLDRNVEEYLKLYSKVSTPEEYDRIVDEAAKLMNDRTLAEECLCFIGEFCAEQVFGDTFVVGDKMVFLRPDDNVTESYKSQLSDYSEIKKAVFRAFRSGVLGDQTNAVFSKFITMSSLNNVMEQVKEKGSPTEKLAVPQIIYNVDNDFILR